MDIRIVVTESGEVVIFVENGTFEQAKELSAKVFDELKAQGLESLDVSPPEQHRHSHDHAHEHAHNHARE